MSYWLSVENDNVNEVRYRCMVRNDFFNRRARKKWKLNYSIKVVTSVMILMV